ncbi:glycerate kinase-like [Branchiostoma lanceolatum]|uniref:glycerate kinase-like n=1 Tax=Branchiostoma lanceolatum TaxID=7740 RepID=UPI0034545BFF
MRAASFVAYFTKGSTAFLLRKTLCDQLTRMAHGGTVDNVVVQMKTDVKTIFNAAVDSVLPRQMVHNTLKLSGNVLDVEDRSYMLNHNVHVVGFGKAVGGMIRAVEEEVGDHIVGGVASVPLGTQESLRTKGRGDLLPLPDSKVVLMEGAADNLPDEAAHTAAQRISDHVSSLTAGDLLIVLISGGGSALLPAPVPSVTLQEKRSVIRLLAARGATINELNTVRKNLSTLKGGKLALAARPAQVISLILSDIVGDHLDLIASGPTVPDSSTPQDAINVIHKYDIQDDIPLSVWSYLTRQYQRKSSKDRDFSHVQNVLVGSNGIAVSAAKVCAEKLGYRTLVHSTCLQGEASSIGEMYATMAALLVNVFNGRDRIIEKSLFNSLLQKYGVDGACLRSVVQVAVEAESQKKPVCVISAGETTVTLRGDGKGGRNQEMALATAVAMSRDSSLRYECHAQVVFMSAGTDGQDGPTDAAGALADPGQVTRADEQGLAATEFLENNDSYNFYKSADGGQGLVTTGLTGTNVMDIQILTVCGSYDSNL